MHCLPVRSMSWSGPSCINSEEAARSPKIISAVSLWWLLAILWDSASRPAISKERPEISFPEAFVRAPSVWTNYRPGTLNSGTSFPRGRANVNSFEGYYSAREALKLVYALGHSSASRAARKCQILQHKLHQETQKLSTLICKSFRADLTWPRQAPGVTHVAVSPLLPLNFTRGGDQLINLINLDANPVDILLLPKSWCDTRCSWSPWVTCFIYNWPSVFLSESPPLWSMTIEAQNCEQII